MTEKKGKEKQPTDPREKAVRRRENAFAAIAYILAFGLMIIGIVVNKHSVLLRTKTAGILCAVFCILPIVLTAVFALVNNRIVKRVQGMKAAEVQTFLHSHREHAEKTTAEKEKALIVILALTDLWAITLGLSAASGAFFCGCAIPDSGIGVVVVFFTAFVLTAAFSQIRLPLPEVNEEEARKIEMKKQTCPMLYTLAERAREETGCLLLGSVFSGSAIPTRRSESEKSGRMLRSISTV